MTAPKITKETLVDFLKRYDSICVAYSGGVDSTLLLSVAAQALPGHVTAVIGTGDFVPEQETREAIAFCRSLSIEPIIIPVDFLGNPLVAGNSTDRCYHCKHMIFGEILKVAQDRGIAVVMDGTNIDDLSDYRPGLRALKVLNIVSPFVEVGLTKTMIRELSQADNLPTWNKPALSCIASRVPTGEPLRKEDLKAIELGEELLSSLGLRQYRLRTHKEVARIEVHPDDFPIVLAHRKQIISELKILGFRYVSMDLEGYKTGNMNQSESSNPTNRI